MAKKLSTAEAQLALHLYELRRETEMRKARSWYVSEFWPQSAEDYMKISTASGTPENAWMRQVGSYWGMAASFALRGAMDTDFFLQPAISGEMVLVFAKIHPFLKQLREKIGDPEAFGNIEKVIESSKYGRHRLKLMLKRIETQRATRPKKTSQ